MVHAIAIQPIPSSDSKKMSTFSATPAWLGCSVASRTTRFTVRRRAGTASTPQRMPSTGTAAPTQAQPAAQATMSISEESENDHVPRTTNLSVRESP